MNVQFFETARVSCLKIVFSPAHSISSSYIPIQAGRGQPPMRGYMKRRKRKAWSSLRASTFSPMLDFQREMVYLPLIVGFVTISLNGAVQIYGMISLSLKITYRHDYRPRTKEELFNLRHSSARNVIERIFGVLKQRFRILLLPPAFGLDIQARIPASLSALHNFIRVWDPDEGSLPEDAEDDPHSFANAQGDINEGGIDEQKGSDRRDQIALAMWEDYQRVCQDRGIDGDNLLDDLSDDEYDTMSDFLQ